jgi:hypothetical protein
MLGAAMARRNYNGKGPFVKRTSDTSSYPVAIGLVVVRSKVRSLSTAACTYLFVCVKDKKYLHVQKLICHWVSFVFQLWKKK